MTLPRSRQTNNKEFRVSAPASILIHPNVSKTASPPHAAWRVYGRANMRDIPQLAGLPPDLVDGIGLAARVFPFRVNGYALDHLIDWDNPTEDAMFRLLFPMPQMLGDRDREILSGLVASGASSQRIDEEVMRIRSALNPDSSEQSANVPTLDGHAVDGVQHKYPETVLAFPSQGQTCHSYCTFCFRWPQFVDTDGPKFELKDPGILARYLSRHPGVTDVLFTGGDPLVMSSRRLSEYLQPLCQPELSHVQTIRLGTKVLTYWPHRFLSGDAEELLLTLRRLVDSGKNVALMAHVNHWRELMPEPVQEAVSRLRQAAVVVRTQSPVLRHINDDSDVWARNWTTQVRLGLIPYYMFLGRDTGASEYFQVPIARALKIYQGAMSRLSGLAKTARGPIMSAGPGKVQVVGTLKVDEREHFVLKFLQARRQSWLDRLFLAEYSPTAHWLDELNPVAAERFFFAQEYSELLLQGLAATAA